MKKAGLVILFHLVLFISLAQNIYFNKRIDITGNTDVCRGIMVFNKGYLVAGGHTGNIIYMSFLDSIGNLKWTQHYTQAGYMYFFGLSGSLFQTKDKYIAFCGTRVPQPKGYGILFKVDSLGNKKWEKEYQLLNYDNSLNSGNITKDSGFILTGDALSGTPKYCYLLLKTDSLGNLKWYQTYSDNHPNRNYAGKSVIQTPDSGYCIGGGGGYWNASNYYSIVEIIKTDSLGNEKWKKTYGNPLYCNGIAMLCLSKDSCIIATYSLGNTALNADDMQNYITKIGQDGIVKWNKKIGRLELDNWPAWIQTLDDGSFIIGGNNFVRDTVNKHIGWLFKLNSNGDSLWYREYEVIHGILDGNELWQVTSTPDKGFAVAGSLFPNSAGGTQDIWVFKTDSVGCLVHNCDGTGITQFNPNAGAQMLVYPNPFNEAFAINYSIPKENKKAVFQLHDIYGKLVYQIGLTTSVNQLQVVASSLKPGIYLASLVIDDVRVCTEKIIHQ